MSENTLKSFRDKWENNPEVAFGETLREGSSIQNWILTRNGFSNIKDLTDYLADKKNILDAGCGNGRVTALLRENSPEDSVIYAIDASTIEVAKENLKEYDNILIKNRDLLEDNTDLGLFDFIYCQEVLHHTNNAKMAFSKLAGLLNDYGEIAIYVYKKKAPIREYTDDYVRNMISDLDYEEAYEHCKLITKLGMSLDNLDTEIEVPDISVLGIEGGKYSIQRFFYHYFMKCFYSKELSIEDNIAINYDWYHPQLCTRHTLDEVREWFLSENLEIISECVDHYGITIRGKRNPI